MGKRRQKKTILLILLALIMAVGYLIVSEIDTERQKVGTSYISIGPMKDALPLTDVHNKPITHTAYTLLYNEECEQAVWVAYKLTKKMVLDNKVERKTQFNRDEMVSSESAGPDDYRHSGFHRGHLVPAADMSWAEEAMSETFLMSNISPMAPGFNMGLWKRLENAVRRWAENEDSLLVICGPIISGNEKKIGPDSSICIPERFFKIVFDLSPPRQKMIAFVMYNRSGGGDIFNYATSVDEVEKLTGHDFFQGLPKQKKIAEMEANMDILKWE